MSERLAIVTTSDLAAFEGRLAGGGEARTFAEMDAAAVWAPGAVIALDQLWRRAPRPVPDDVFELAPAPAGVPVLLAGGSDAERAELRRELGLRGLPAAEAAQPDRAALAAAAIVLLAGSPGATLHPAAPAVLAAGRTLIAPRANPGFGLEPGIDHLAYEHPVGAAEWADAVTRDPHAFEQLRAFGRVTAEAHRASAVYARWLTDLRLTTPPPPAPPRA